MIMHEMRTHIFDSLKEIFASEIASRKLEIVFGLNEMPALDSIRLSNSSNLRTAEHALGHNPGVYKAEIDFMIMIDVLSAFDPLSNEAVALDYANRCLYAFVTDRESEFSLQAFQNCYTVELEFMTVETDQIGQGLISTVVMSIIWKGEVDDSNEI